MALYLDIVGIVLDFHVFSICLVQLICAVLKALAKGLPLRRVRPGCVRMGIQGRDRTEVVHLLINRTISDAAIRNPNRLLNV